VSRSLPLALALVVLAGYVFSSSSGASVASKCTSARTEPGLKLVLSNESPTPQVRGRVGVVVVVEVVSSYYDGRMTFPTARPSNAVCEVSRHRSRDGAATVIYKALRETTVRFFSGYTHATDVADPAMMGRLIVR
jgi:hypothetical protein